MRTVERTGVYRLDTFWPVRESPHRSRQGAGRGREVRTRRDAASTRISLTCHGVAGASVTAKATAGSSGHDARATTDFPGNGRGSFALAQASPAGTRGRSKALPRVRMGMNTKPTSSGIETAAPWQEMLTTQQRKFLCDMCGDLADQLPWHGGIRLTKDDYRHMLAGTVMGWRTMPGISRDGEPRGWIMLGGSSLDLTKDQCADAITLALHIGDHPEEQGLQARPVQWGYSVMRGLGYTDADLRELAA